MSWEQGASPEGRLPLALSRGCCAGGVLPRTQGVSKAKLTKDCRLTPERAVLLPRGTGDGSQPGVLKPLCLIYIYVCIMYVCVCMYQYLEAKVSHWIWGYKSTGVSA